MPLIDDLQYLALEAFEFSLEVNPHAGVYDSVEEHTSARTGDDPLGDWISEEQHAKALETGRLIEGRVYPNGSVTFNCFWGTEVADVVAACARLCREGRERWNKANGATQPQPFGRRAED